MKTSIALAIAIVVIGVVPGLFQHQRLAQLREEHHILVAEAVKYGLSESDSAEVRQTKRNRLEMSKQAGAIADEIVALLYETLRSSGEEENQDVQDRRMEMKSRLASMEPSLLRQVIASLEGKQGIPDDFKRNIIGFAILNLSEEDPEAAVELFTQAHEILEKSDIGDHVIFSSLSRWAEISPEPALTWLRDNPDVAGDQAKRAVISGTAVNDPALAFTLIDDLYPGDKSAAIQAILASSHEAPEKRDIVLAALRERLASMGDKQERDELRAEAFESYARNLSAGGFEACTTWVEKAGFSAEEKIKFSAGLSYFNTKEETGRWIEWLSTNLAAESVTESVSLLVSEWTQEDYQSAGKWLHSAKDGPAKMAAVQSYATVVAEYDPTVATHWAMTLPAGPERDSTLQSIYQNWPGSDPDGAAAFAREHGLE